MNDFDKRFKKAQDDFDKDFTKAERVFWYIAVFNIAIVIGILSFLGWAIVQLLQFFGVI